MNTERPYRLYGVPEYGSVIVECALTACNAAYDFIDVTGFDAPGEARDRLLEVNRLAQVPALITPTGEVLTESAAIALLLSEQHPEAGLAPPPGSDNRPLFLRLLVWIVANIYPTFTYGDDPRRWTDSAGLRETTDRYREQLWRQFEALAPNRPWVLGEDWSVLDIYVTVMTQWRPGPRWFRDHCSRLADIADRGLALDRFSAVLERNFSHG